MVPKPSPRGERLRSPNRLAMNSRFPKRMVSLREKPSHDKHSLLVAAMNTDDGTIKTSGGKSTMQIPLPGMPSIGVSYTEKI
jgi:hypothetical protein